MRKRMHGQAANRAGVVGGLGGWLVGGTEHIALIEFAERAPLSTLYHSIRSPLPPVLAQKSNRTTALMICM